MNTTLMLVLMILVWLAMAAAAWVNHHAVNDRRREAGLLRPRRFWFQP